MQRARRGLHSCVISVQGSQLRERGPVHSQQMTPPSRPNTVLVQTLVPPPLANISGIGLHHNRGTWKQLQQQARELTG